MPRTRVPARIPTQAPTQAPTQTPSRAAPRDPGRTPPPEAAPGPTRRRLLLGGLAAAALPALPAAAQPATGEDETRPLPGGGRIPAVGLGTWITFNVGEDPKLLARCTRVMAAFFEEGGGMIDSSPMYGSSQATIGHGLAELGRPASLFSADKVWTSDIAEGPAQIARTRQAWGVPRFDLLQVHNLRAAEGHLETLFARREAGELRHVGITTSHGRRHGEMERLMTRHSLDFVQLTCNALDRAAEDRLLPLARERGIAVIANRPYRRGALIRRMQGVPLPPFAAALGAESWAQLLLKFILSRPEIAAAIPATTRPEHVRENKRAARTPLPDAAQRAAIAAAVRDA